ncbi:MAG TPA: glycosyltransferase [Solirubrobacteraceae bacterium]
MDDAAHAEPGPGADGRVDCSVLMPVLDEERHIAASVAAMRRQRFPGRLEFLVVDGGSSDRTRQILAELAREEPRMRVLENPRRSTPSGLNVALAHARGRWVARMDAHTAYPDDYVALGVQRLARGDTSWVSGPAIPTGDGSVSRAVALALRTALGRGGSRKWTAARGASNGELELDAGVFAGVWPRDLLLAYGGWDEEWSRNQDSEMAGRFLARGEKLICLAGMASEYTPRDSLLSLWRQYLEYGEYREKTAVRHPQTMRRSHLLIPGLVLTVGAAVASPSPVRRAARVGVALYSGALAGAGVVAAREEDAGTNAALVPLVLAVMHLGFGVGFLRGVTRHGAPLAAAAGALGLTRLASTLSADPPPVFAPSLAAGEDPAQ